MRVRLRWRRWQEEVVLPGLKLEAGPPVMELMLMMLMLMLMLPMLSFLQRFHESSYTT